MRVYDGYLVCLDLSTDLPGNGARNPSCYLLSMCWSSLEEERVMQQSRVSIFLSYETKVINPVGDNAQATEYLHKQTPTCTQRDKGVVNPFTVICNVRSDRDG